MSQIILDISANTHKNNEFYIFNMIDELKYMDTGKHEIIIKHQLFEKAGDNIPLNHSVFKSAYYYAKDSGYKTTSSVFDLPSLNYLLKFDIPFVKIANRPDLYWLSGEVPRKTFVYVSAHYLKDIMNVHSDLYLSWTTRVLYCESKYPAEISDYDHLAKNIYAYDGISDHTIGLELYKKYKPQIWEKHFKLQDSTGLDAGAFAITPDELAEIL